MYLPKGALSCLCLSALCVGCTFSAADSAAFSPYNQAPGAPDKYWTPPAAAYKHTAYTAPVLPKKGAPLTLAELIDIALQNNTATQMSWATARTAAAQYGESESGAFPTLSADYTYERSLTPDISKGQENPHKLKTDFLSQWGPQLSLSYTLLDFGQLRATSQAARYALFFADWSHNREIQTVIQTITTDYYHYLYQKALLEAYSADVENAQATFDQASLEMKLGIKDIADFLFAQTSLLRMQMQAEAQQQLVVTATAKLLSAMGLPATSSFEVEGFPASLPAEMVLQDVEALLEIALQERADLLAAEADLKSKQESVKAAMRQWWPTLSYTFDIGRSYFSGGRRDDYDFDSLLSLNFPIFSGFSVENQIKTAKAQREFSRATLRQKRLDIIQEVSTSHSGVKISFETLELSDHLLQSAEKQYQVTLSKYKAGTTPILDVVASQNALAHARSSRASALQGWYTSLANLNYAVGQLEFNK